MTGSFMPPCPRAYTPPIPLDATAVLSILAAHDPALYNRVMQVATEYCCDVAKTLAFQGAQMSEMECKS